MKRSELEHVIRAAAIGEGSRFHQEFGYYAQGVDERTAVLPRIRRDFCK